MVAIMGIGGIRVWPYRDKQWNIKKKMCLSFLPGLIPQEGESSVLRIIVESNQCICLKNSNTTMSTGPSE